MSDEKLDKYDFYNQYKKLSRSLKFQTNESLNSDNLTIIQSIAHKLFNNKIHALNELFNCI